ncbi:hypothetical protein [Acinetobacter sp. YH12098]|uniref:hypothetical protein n=1 Tax=Acinetobacter sp. YH12098 TaxID=2601087 RepID=UPI00359F1B28
MSNDPIGLLEGLHNTKYVSDPNQWVDPMGLMGGKDNGLFWLTDSASEESNNQIKNMVQQSRNNPNNKTQLELIQSDAEKGRVLRANTPAVSPTESQRNDFPVINNSRGSSNGGVLAKLLPNTMSPLAKDPQLAQDLKAQGAMRNNNLGAVAVAGYAPYAIVGGKEAAPVVLKVGREGIKSIPSLSKTALQNAKNISATPVGQAVVKTTGGSVLVDSSLQAKDMYKCKCLQWDGSRSLVAVGTGAAFGAWGGGAMAQTAKVPFVGTTGVPTAIAGKNTGGLVIWANQFALQQTSSRAINSSTSDDKKQDK